MPGNICCDSPKAAPSFWVTPGQSDRSWGQGLDLGSREAPRWGWEHSRSHWHSRAGHSAASPATAASTRLHGAPPHPLARGLCPPPGERLFSEQSGKGRQFTTGEIPVCSNTLLGQFSCHKGWELLGCFHSASSQLCHISSLCARALTCPFSIISSREVKPLTNQTKHTRVAASWIVRISEDTRLTSTGAPC